MFVNKKTIIFGRSYSYCGETMYMCYTYHHNPCGYGYNNKEAILDFFNGLNKIYKLNVYTDRF